MDKGKYARDGTECNTQARVSGCAAWNMGKDLPSLGLGFLICGREVEAVCNVPCSDSHSLE